MTRIEAPIAEVSSVKLPETKMLFAQIYWIGDLSKPVRAFIESIGGNTITGEELASKWNQAVLDHGADALEFRHTDALFHPILDNLVPNTNVRIDAIRARMKHLPKHQDTKDFQSPESGL